MAKFEEAYNRTSKFEGGYVNDKNDRGGETYKGIARKFHADWKGWSIIDSYKKKPNFPKNLASDSQLPTLVKNLYRKLYWDAVWGDKLLNQKVANDLYDTAVNMGVGISIKLSQRIYKMKETGKMSIELLNKLNSIV